MLSIIVESCNIGKPATILNKIKMYKNGVLAVRYVKIK